MARYLHGSDMIPPEEVAAGSVTNEMAQRWMQLQQLQVRPPEPQSSWPATCMAVTSSP
jgi:hypothetical protein